MIEFIKRNLIYKIIIFGIFVIIGLILLNQIDIALSPIVRVVLSAIVIFLLPGYFIWNIFLFDQKFEVIEKIPNYFFLSDAALIPLVIAGYLGHFSISLLTNIILAFAAILGMVDIVLTIYRSKIYQKKKKTSKKEKIQFSWIYFLSQIITWKRIRAILLILMAASLALLSYKVGAYFDGDAKVHLSIIRKMIVFGTSADNPFFKDFGDLSIFKYSLLHPLYSSVAYLAKVDPLFLWEKMAIFVCPIIIFAGYFFARCLFGNRNIAFICVAVLFYLIGFADLLTSGTIKDINLIMYPSGIALMILVPVFLGWFFIYVDKKERKIWFLLAAGGYVLLLTHMYYFFLTTLALTAFLILFFIVKRKGDEKFARVWQGFLVVALSALPYVIYQIIFNLNLADLASYHHQISISRGHAIPIWNKWYIIRPRLFLLTTFRTVRTYFTLLSIALVPILFIWFRKKVWAIFLISTILLVPLICLNPLAVMFFEKLIGLPKVVRIYQIAPVYCVIGFFIFWFISFLKPMSGILKFKVASGILLVIITVASSASITTLIKNVRKISQINQPSKQQVFQSNLVREYFENISPGSVILVDGFDGMKVTAMFPDYIVSTDKKHGSALMGSKVVLERRQIQTKILDPKTSITDSVRLLERNRIRYIITRNQVAAEKFKNSKYFHEEITGRKFFLFKFNSDLS